MSDSPRREFPARHPRAAGPIRLTLKALIAGVAAVLGLTVLGLSVFGFPAYVTRGMVAKFNRGDYFCDLRRLSLDFRGGVVAHDVRLYRKGVVGPPFVEAQELRVRFQPLFWRYSGYGRIRGIVVRHGVARPAFYRAGAADAAPTHGGRPAGAAASSGAKARVRCWVEDFDLVGAWVEHGACDAEVDGTSFALRNIEAVVGRELQRGVLRGSVTRLGSGTVKGQCSTTFDPHVLLPILRAAGLERTDVLEWFSFSSLPPSCSAAFEYAPGPEPACRVEGRFQGSGFAYRGAAIDFANITAVYEWSAGTRTLSLNPLVLAVGNRNVSGSLVLDLVRETVDGEMLSTADVMALSRVAGLPEGTPGGRWRLGKGTRVYASGRVGYGDAARSDAEASVEGKGIGYGDFLADDCAFKVACRQGTNIFSDIRGKIAGGSFTGSAFLFRDAADTRFQAKAEMIHADFRKLLSMVNSNAADRCEGRLYGNMELSGVAGKSSTVAGQGSVSMKNGAVFRLPLFGGMTAALADKIPGVNYLLSQTDIRIPFTVRDGRVWSKDAQIEGDVLSLTAEGSCGFDGTLAFDVEVRPMKHKTLVGSALRALTSPVSRLFRLRLEGTLSDPKWRLAPFEGAASATKEKASAGGEEP